MAKEEEFKAWLQQGGAQTAKGRNTRANAIRTIERKLAALGLPYRDLDEAWKADRFKALRGRLGRMRQDARAGGEDYRILMPDSEKPQGRLSNWATWMNQYDRFLAGEPPPGFDKDADRIRQHVLVEYVEPAREDGRGQVEVLVRDVHTALGLSASWPNICQALTGKKFLKLANVQPPERIGAEQSSATIFRFQVDERPPGGGAERGRMTRQSSTTNLILYGPPGTGKTYATAAEAVRLCGEPVPDGRPELMAAYAKLVAAGQTEFVTFHQSMSYEEFVEGLRPDVGRPGSEDDIEDERLAGGFRLTPRDGVFKQISERARLDAGVAEHVERLDRSRMVFKISLGVRGTQEDRVRYGLDNDLIHLGWGGDIDWSDDRFDEFSEIHAEWRKLRDPDASGHDGNVVMTFSFRAAMQVDDYVVASDGRDRVRAFGRVVGEYFYDADADFHPHRRAVRWIWRDDAGADRARFYPKGFRRHSVYRLNQDEIDWDALEGIVLAEHLERTAGEARDFVLIVDEINRADISKVFGELITLLEADKRLGQTNEIRLRLPYSGRMFGVPPNLHILGAMNTADRSIALLDTALRRRFTFREMMPDPSILTDRNARCGIDLPKLLATINDRIEYLFDREHQIGHAYFTDCETREDVDAVMRHKVIPLLAEYFFEDWAKIAAILGDMEQHEEPISGGFLAREVLKAPPGYEDDGGARFRWRVRSAGEGFDYRRLVGE